MRKKSIVSLILMLTIVSSFLGCDNKQKTSILTSDVKQEAANQENEIKKCITDGTEFLNKGKYDEAKSSFEKAISMDKANKGAYIEIKNKYMEKSRIDDAYYIIKLAISNSVDIENMTTLLNDIKSKLEVTKLDVSVYQNNAYKLPTKIKAKINNEDKEVEVVWSNNSVDTNKLGTTKYEGKIERYDRSVELNVKVMKVEKVVKAEQPKKTGWIDKVYEENGQKYITFDDVEFFFDKDGNDKTAETEAKKDGVREQETFGGYYIRNKDSNFATYKVSPNVDIYVRNINDNIKANKKVSFNELATTDLGLGYGLQYRRSILWNIYIENNIVVKMEEQYRP